MDKKYTAAAKWRNRLVYSAECDTREEAARQLFREYPKIKRCATGYGYHGSFDIRAHSRAFGEIPPLTATDVEVRRFPV